MQPAHSYKLSLPGVQRQVPRARQLSALDDAWHHAPLIWLTGPPGAGKSALAAQHVSELNRRGVRVMWYRLSEEDDDIAGVFDAFRRHPDNPPDLELPAWSPDHQAPLPAFTRLFFSQLAQREPLVIVFDDCHRIADGAPWYEMIDAAREVCGANLKLMLISRRRPPPRLERGVLAGWLVVFDDLSLTHDEALVVAEHASGHLWTADEAERLKLAQGWLAHVLAIARAPAGVQVSAQVGDFLAAELLLMLPPEERRLFRLLAELPQVPRALADAERVPPRTVRFLDDLTDAGYFVERTSDKAWRMHDLLRDALRAQNALSDSPAALATERARLATEVADEAPDAAMNLLVAAGDGDGVLALLRLHGQAWLAQGRHRQVMAWLSALRLADAATPPSAAATAELTLWRAEATLPLEPEDARPLFAQARWQLVDEGRAELAYRAWCGQVASYVVQWGAVQGLAELVDELHQLTQRIGEPPGQWRFRTRASAMTALMYGRAEDPRLRELAVDTAAAIDRAPDAGARVIAAAQLLIYRMWWSGDYPGARALYQTFDAQVDAGSGLEPLPRLIWWSNAAVVDWTCGDPARCYDKVERGLALADASGVHVRDFFLLTHGIFCALSQEDLPRARTYLDRLALTASGHLRLDVMVHHYFRTWYCLSLGDAATALVHAEAARTVAEAIGSLFHKVIAYTALAPARAHVGDIDGALEIYRLQLAMAKGSDNLPFTYNAFCAGAEIAVLAGDEVTLAKQLERILIFKQLGSFHSDCGWRTSMRARWFAFALAHDIHRDVVRQWIREKQVPPPDGYIGEWPMGVRIRAYDGLVVEIDERKAASSGKPAAKLRELLAVLVAARDGATQSNLCDWLWPMADGDKAAGSLKAGVHRLRGWLGAQSVVVQDGMVALNAQRVQCDLWQWMDGDVKLPPPDPDQVLQGFDAPPIRGLKTRISKQLRSQTLDQ